MTDEVGKPLPPWLITEDWDKGTQEIHYHAEVSLSPLTHMWDGETYTAEEVGDAVLVCYEGRPFWLYYGRVGDLLGWHLLPREEEG